MHALLAFGYPFVHEPAEQTVFEAICKTYPEKQAVQVPLED